MYRNDLDALKSRHAALAADAARVARERDDAKQALDEAERHTQSPDRRNHTRRERSIAAGAAILSTSALGRTALKRR